MSDRIDSITAALERSAAEVRETFAGHSSEQLNWKPADGGWSIGQCLEHIIKTNEEFYSEFEKLASGTRKNTFWQSYSPFTRWGGRFLIKAVSEDSKKAKAPSKKIVPPSDIPADIVERFSEHISEVIGKVSACSRADLKNTVVSSPFLSVFTYTLDDAYTVLVEHTKRHIRQARRVMQSDGFPALERSASVG